MTPNRRQVFAGSAAIAAAMALPVQAQQAPAAPPANPGFYRFRLGGLTVIQVHDGINRRPVEGFVRNAPLPEVQAALTARMQPADTLTIPFTLTFVETPTGLVVFDAGTGEGQMSPTSGRMGANMRAAGLDPAQVRAVIVSHFHGDHIIGLTNAAGERAFPNAEVVVPAAEWAWWSDEGNAARTPEGQRGNFANTARRFAPWRERMRQLADGAEAWPGIRAIAAPGHTPGHTCYHVADGSEQLLYLADVTNRPEVMMPNPGWQIVFDMDGDAAAATRRRMLDRAASDRLRVTGYHLPFPAQGMVAREGEGFRFVPGDWTGI